MYKIYLISAEEYENANVEVLPKTNGKIWVRMKNVQGALGVINMPDLILKEMYGICETKNPAKEQVKKYKMTGREYFRRFDNLSKKELNKKNNKEAYIRNDVMSTVLNCCIVEKNSSMIQLNDSGF